MSSEYIVLQGTRRSIFVPQSRVVKRGFVNELSREGATGVYFQPWDFDFLARPVHVPGGAILEYVEVTEARLDPSNHVKGTYYAFANVNKGGLV
jgi:hypothetical protein